MMRAIPVVPVNFQNIFVLERISDSDEKSLSTGGITQLIQFLVMLSIHMSY